MNKDKTKNVCMLSDTGGGKEGGKQSKDQQASSLSPANKSCSINEIIVMDQLNFGSSDCIEAWLQLGQ